MSNYKNLEQIKDEVAKSKGYTSWKNLKDNCGSYFMEVCMDEVCKRYATGCVKASLEKASNEASFKRGDQGYDGWEINKSSITDSKNIILL